MHPFLKGATGCDWKMGWLPVLDGGFHTWVYLQIIHWNGIFHYKPSFLGHPMTMETPRWVWVKHVKICQNQIGYPWITQKKWKVWSVWSSEDEKMQSGSIATPYRGPADGLLAGWTKLHRKGTTSWILEVDLGWNRIPAMDIFDDLVSQLRGHPFSQNQIHHAIKLLSQNCSWILQYWWLKNIGSAPSILCSEHKSCMWKEVPDVVVASSSDNLSPHEFSRLIPMMWFYIFCCT